MVDLLLDGFMLMVVGMTIVFGFLLLLILAMLAMSKIAQRFDTTEITMTVARSVDDRPDNTPPLAVLTAAIAYYRHRHSITD